jgi:hypothetical protein
MMMMMMVMMMMMMTDLHEDIPRGASPVALVRESDKQSGHSHEKSGGTLPTHENDEDEFLCNIPSLFSPLIHKAVSALLNTTYHGSLQKSAIPRLHVGFFHQVVKYIHIHISLQSRGDNDEQV